MRRYFFITAIIAGLLLCAGAISAQGVVPGSIAGWNATTKTSFIPPSAALTPDLQTALREYGFASGEEADFANAAASIHVRLYQMKDPSGAYGLYSYLRTPDMPHADLTAHSSMSRNRALALSGNMVLEVRGGDLPKLASDLKAFANAIASHAEEGPLPTLPQHMPTSSMIDRSDHYVLGPQTLNQFFQVSGASSDWLGFSEGAEAEVAKYRVNGKEVTLVVADFPTPQSAIKKLAELKSKYNMIGIQDPTSASSTDSRSSTEPNAPVLFAKRSVTLIAVASGAANQADAAALLKQVHSGTELTWNEPSFELTQPNIGTIVVGTIIGTGIICAFAIISGFAFGGVRLVVKRMLPDKVFDRSSHLQVLQLGLSSKPIKSEDFYGLGGPTRE